MIENENVVVNDDIDDVNDVNDTPETEKRTVDKILDWAKDHKKELIVGSVAGAIGTILGAKALSKTEIKEVEKLPDPTIMDKYDRVPVEEHSYIDYKYVLKPEYREDDD